MKSIINLLFVACIVISCGNENQNNVSKESEELVKQSKNNNHIIEILKQPSMFSSLVEEFESVSVIPNEEHISVKSFIFPSDNITCVVKSNKELCQQTLKYFQDNELSFTSYKESVIVEEFSERYSSFQQGIITIGQNNYDADLYFKCIYDSGRMMFSGKLIFHFPEISLLEDRPIVIDIKAKK